MMCRHFRLESTIGVVETKRENAMIACFLHCAAPETAAATKRKLITWGQCPLWVVCHEHRHEYWRRATVREMKEGPSGSVIRSRSQATASCCRQKRWW